MLDYIRRLRHEMDSKDYHACVPLLKEYKDFLEKIIENTPNDVEAACQLAAIYMELRMKTEVSKNLLEKVLQNDNEISGEEKVRTYTNLAWYYEDYGDLDLCREYLEKAIALTPSVPNAYDALGRLYSNGDNTDNALSLFRVAAKLGNELKYQYNYAVSLYQNNLLQEAKDFFEDLLITNENNPLILYGLGVCCYALNDKKSAVVFANRVVAVKENEDVNESQIADLFYLCDEPFQHNAMYDNCKWGYYTDASWLGPYFYCLSVQKKTDELVQKFTEVIDEKKQNINDWENESDPEYTDEDKQERIQCLEKEKVDIESVYHRIVAEGFKPEVKINIGFIYGCYMIDCPRHQRIE